ncbi:hypothetical protein [Roseibium sediminicola]|uniref:Uncharacterized protein n=1 Tax=Roseibium sediminicola TaxID=2933272 RepID=A0ABT0GZR6_9HYPH|nr:hypothetical protein [Roseibium sp. CAU 1639]MCK7614927.1 hypothetical protein [Roseibium sp. CAU 1639]
MPKSSDNETDAEAASNALGKLLLNADEKLKPLGNEPILIIAYPHKFNDADYDDYWCAVQIGRSYWEASQFYRHAYLDGYGSGREPENDRGAGHITERANYASGTSNQDGKTPEALRNALKAARTVLSDLEKTVWRDLAVKALGVRDSYGLGLYLINGGLWLIQTHYSGADEGTAWYCNSAGELSYFAEAMDATTGIGNPIPIRFGDVGNEAVGKLGGAARDWYFPPTPTVAFPERCKSLQELSDLLLTVAGRLRANNADPVTLSSIKTEATERHPNIEVRWLGNGFHRSQDNRFVQEEDRNPYFSLLKTHQIQVSNERMLEIVQAAGKQLDFLETQGWRRLFGEAFASPLQDHDALHLMIVENEINLLRGNSAFCLQGGLLKPVGLLSDWEIVQY